MSYTVNKEKADMETKSQKACMGHLILTPCSVTAEERTAEMGFHPEIGISSRNKGKP